MNDSPLAYHLKGFFADQEKAALAEQRKMDRSKMRDLLATRRLSLAYPVTVNDYSGSVILKCFSGQAPRLNVQKGMALLKRDAYRTLGPKPSQWSCTWEEFCRNKDFHSPDSDLFPTRFVDGKEAGYDYFECVGLSDKMYQLLSNCLAEGKAPALIIHDPFPPVDYFRNLADYIDMAQDNGLLALRPKIQYADWHPRELPYDPSMPTAIADTIVETLAQKHYCIVQGPPGTGKSHTIASVLSTYLDAGKTVCVATMANKGLMSLLGQEPLQKYVKGGRIHKTNLTPDERKQCPGLRDSSPDLSVAAGELLCATYYQLSKACTMDYLNQNQLPLSYDLVVIEEASQAFLATIAAFSQLGSDVLVVCDPMQLPPIADLTNPQYRSWNVSDHIQGLKTLILGSDRPAFRLVSTFRLPPRSAALTGLFYDSRLHSVANPSSAALQGKYFPQDGGTLYHCTNDGRMGVFSESAQHVIDHVLSTIKDQAPDTTVALITPFRESLRRLQQRYSNSQTCRNLTVETIDRIQGMTVDYAVLYIPARNPGFAVDECRFNVATSRARHTTLIVSDLPLENLPSLPHTIARFLAACPRP